MPFSERVLGQVQLEPQDADEALAMAQCRCAVTGGHGRHATTMARVTDAAEFGRAVLILAVGFAAAILSSRLSEWLRVPAPALFLAAAAVSSDIVPSITPLLSIRDVERICLVALIVILFDGGMDIGRRRFRRSLWPIVALGVPGTFAVAGLLALFVHAVLGLGWTPSLLIGAAVAPTDPAVMFSVLGGREVAGPQRRHPQGRVGRQRPGRHRAGDRPAGGGRPERLRRRRHRLRLRHPDGGRRSSSACWAGSRSAASCAG